MKIQQLHVSTLLAGLTLTFVLSASPASAQEMDDIESLFSAEEEAVVLEPEVPTTPEVKPEEIKDLSDLSKLSPFKDVAVIQKRFLPKTGRFELFGGGSLILNDAFFQSVGFSGRLAYYFQERYGVEFVSFLLSTSERQVTTDLHDKRGVSATSFVTPKSYIGLDFKYTPFYGKMTWLNKKITPFDLYFSIGGGSTTTNQGGSAPTLHIGTGQVFALSKSVAFRWDFSWNFFSATSNVSGAESSSTYNNLFITAGMSWFFPEATYR